MAIRSLGKRIRLRLQAYIVLSRLFFSIMGFKSAVRCCGSGRNVSQAVGVNKLALMVFMGVNGDSRSDHG